MLIPLPNLKWSLAPHTPLDASAKVCDSNFNGFEKLRPYHLEIFIDSISYRDTSKHFKSVGRSLLQSNFCYHSSWIISLGSKIAGNSIPSRSNIELIKLRIPVFVFNVCSLLWFVTGQLQDFEMSPPFSLKKFCLVLGFTILEET